MGIRRWNVLLIKKNLDLLCIFSEAIQIEATEYLNESISGEVLGGVGQGVDVISKVADDLIFMGLIYVVL